AARRAHAAGDEAAALDSLAHDAARLERGAEGPMREGPPSGEENLTRLNGELAGLFRAVENADERPTDAMTAAAAELEQALATLTARGRELAGRAPADRH
ncbi:MAG TPA: hypothetical protein VGU27_10815, partial [Candidatus Eisenbacteria bacterium]|nr:hypothetical protein [Candidatus Eisenbacteria bacterium]